MTQPVLPLWINGKAQASSGPRTADVFNPATGKAIRRTPLANKQDVESAVAAAREVDGDWARHARAARDLAVERFDARRVLGRLAEAVAA